MRYLALLTLITLLADLPEWNAPEEAERRKNPIRDDFFSRDAGKNVFLTNCASCHGPAGHGDGPLAPNLNPRPAALCDPDIQAQSDGSMFWKISTGRGPMPSFEKTLSEEDRWNAVNYVRTFGR